MKGEIYAGLRSAIERGEKVEDAVNSFINAGYNPEEVKEAARMITGGATEVMSYGGEGKITQVKKLPPLPMKKEIMQTTRENKTESGGGKRIAVIIMLIVILLALVGTAVYLFLNLPE